MLCRCRVQGFGLFLSGTEQGRRPIVGLWLTVVLQLRPEAAVASLVAFVESQAALQASRSLPGSPPALPFGWKLGV